MKTRKRNEYLKLGFFTLLASALVACSSSPDINQQVLTLNWDNGEKVFMQEMLPGEIAETEITHVSYAGPTVQHVAISEDNTHTFIFVKGNATLIADTTKYAIVPETIAIPMAYKSVAIEVAVGDTLHYLEFKKKLTAKDVEDRKSFPAENQYDIYFTKFEDCEPYTEKIKSPNTVSRTVLHKAIVPRFSLGTVEAPGPDAVGAHEHPMLDQLFLGLADNDITVHADKKSVRFKGLSLLHIPIGSSHWVTVEENKRMYYMWMDFFMTKEGEEWLNTHKKIDDYKSE